jgi:hypothetical protein
MSPDSTEQTNAKEDAHMHVPRYYLPRPALQLDATTIAAYEALWTHITTAPEAGELPYSLPMPRWQFLCYLADHKPVVLHGSGNPNVIAFEPRQAADVIAFGNRAAVYAASDGIWPIYYAILDRDQYAMSLTNACIRVVTPTGEASEPFYFFSISQTALVYRPWRTGTVYILPRTTFEPQPPIPSGDSAIHVLQWASPMRVVPLAKLHVTPADFPFLDQIRGHDDQIQHERARANPDGFPWIDDA